MNSADIIGHMGLAGTIPVIGIFFRSNKRDHGKPESRTNVTDGIMVGGAASEIESLCRLTGYGYPRTAKDFATMRDRVVQEALACGGNMKKGLHRVHREIEESRR